MIYTAITDGKDSPRTDIKVFSSYNKFKDPTMNAKIYKVLSHKYIKDEYSVWVDGNLTLRISEDACIKLLGDSDIAVFENPYRDCLFDEIDECIRLRLDTKEALEGCRRRYKSFPKHNGLGTCFLIIRRHTEQIKRLNEEWWAAICSGSRRDQISFPVVFAGVVKYLPKVHPFENEFFTRQGHLKKN